jgi:cytochrome P450 family 619
MDSRTVSLRTSITKAISSPKAVPSSSTSGKPQPHSPFHAILILTFRGIHPDPQRYEYPGTFYPERFMPWRNMPDPYTQTADPNDRDHYSYGAGRRICVGIHIVERNLLINIAKLVWAFNFQAKEGQEALNDSPEQGYSPGFVIAPWPYQCEVVMRDGKVKEVVEREMRGAMEVIGEYA